MGKRRFDKEIRFRVTKEMELEVKAAAKREGKSTPEFLRKMVNSYIITTNFYDIKSHVQSYVASAVEEKLKPVENRLAKINAKTAHATAISIFLLAQTLADLGKRDVVEVFKIARRKGIEFVRTSVPNTAELEELTQLAAKAKEV